MTAARDSRFGEDFRALSVQCYAFGGGNSWEAVCTDFDIGVSGASLSEVRSSLETCIELYVEEIAAASPDHRGYLLARRSPWFVRVKLACLTWISALRAGVRESQKFTLQPQVRGLS